MTWRTQLTSLPQVKNASSPECIPDSDLQPFNPIVDLDRHQSQHQAGVHPDHHDGDHYFHQHRDDVHPDHHDGGHYLHQHHDDVHVVNAAPRSYAAMGSYAAMDCRYAFVRRAASAHASKVDRSAFLLIAPHASAKAAFPPCLASDHPCFHAPASRVSKVRSLSSGEDQTFYG